MRAALLAAAVTFCLALLPGCGESEQPAVSENTGPPEEDLLSGTIGVDGPRILRSLLLAAAANFHEETSVDVQVGQAGTETALDKLCSGRIAIAGARRGIRPAEREACARRGIGLTRLRIANHVVGVATSTELAMRCITMRQLRELWGPGSAVTRYDQLDGDFPDEQVKLYGPKIGHDSFALFTRLVNGQRGAIRAGWETVVNWEGVVRTAGQEGRCARVLQPCAAGAGGRGRAPPGDRLRCRMRRADPGEHPGGAVPTWGGPLPVHQRASSQAAARPLVHAGTSSRITSRCRWWRRRSFRQAKRRSPKASAACQKPSSRPVELLLRV